MAKHTLTEFVRNKTRERAEDPKVPEKLIPTCHPFGTTRVSLESSYCETYNQDNVELVDLHETPIARITPSRIKTSEAEYRLDVIVFATGIDAVTWAFRRLDTRGVGRWAKYVSGSAERRFPEFFHSRRSA